MNVDELRGLALALPEAVEVETWGHPTFRVRKKMFASCSADGSADPTATFKATLGEQGALVASNPEVYGVPGYVGRHGWVQVRLEGVDPAAMREHLIDAWRATAPKSVVARSGL
ncbi:MmcQ/YjbR family DNA-binding protein [Cryptosporangium phraense]|uniref:MmcQ/YjbR family DNA-binding protein n=1 Tax=Cryptosporangium phraense TaxID=2593070 RepID=A0A545AW78_9ACTN|nr:MmcQ/YjbR family DNA-binding protein [Cryptosporangium phraense]TQS45589.1 MmcQ/YjbR family DNA-binding protein [Cryptosporangium phraense]